MTRRFLVSSIVVMALLMVMIPLAAQVPSGPSDGELPPDVFAPFVSRLRVAVRDPQVRITWRDAEEMVGGTYEVLRSTNEITQETLGQAQVVAVVQPGTETYLDTPLEAGGYFYAVVARDTDGHRYDIFIPFRNKTIRPVTISQLTSEEDLAVAVYGIAAQIEDQSVIVRYETSRTDRTLVIYRGTAPITSIEALQEAVLVREVDSSVRRFQDFPVPGVGYYYAVVDKALIERGTAAFEAGNNTLAQPIQIAIAAEPEFVVDLPQSRTRRAPLPMLQFGDNAAAVPAVARPVGGPTREAIAQLLDGEPPAARFAPEPVVLPQERAADEEGAARTLAQIATGEFAAGNYERSLDLLDSLLRLPLSNRVAARARFYRGQSLFFLGHTERALMDLLLALNQGELYASAKPWVDGLLNDLVRQRLADR